MSSKASGDWGERGEKRGTITTHAGHVVGFWEVFFDFENEVGWLYARVIIYEAIRISELPFIAMAYLFVLKSQHSNSVPFPSQICPRWITERGEKKNNQVPKQIFELINRLKSVCPGQYMAGSAFACWIDNPLTSGGTFHLNRPAHKRSLQCTLLPLRSLPLTCNIRLIKQHAMIQ